MEKKFPTAVENSPGGVLALLFRKVMQEAGLIPYVDVLVEKYVRKTKLNNVSSVKRQTKSTLLTNITSSSMTFKVFIDLIFYYIGAKKLDITIKVTHANGDETIHHISSTPNVTQGDVNGDSEGGDTKSN